VSLPAAAPALPARPLWRQLYVQVLVAILAGGLIGWLAPETGVALKPLGDGFIRLVKMVVPPVVFLTIVIGIAGMRSLGGLGRVVGRTFVYFLSVSTLALVIGLVVANLVKPGAGLHIDPASLSSDAIADYVKKAESSGLTGFLIEVIPESMLGAFTSGNLLQVLFLAIFCGIALGRVGEAGVPLLRLLESAQVLVFRLVAMFMALAPLGAFGAFAFTIGKFGVGAIANLAGLMATFYVTSLLFVLVVLGAIARAAGFSILRLIAYLRAELFLVLGTSSSEAALPSLMEKMTAAGCPRALVGLVVPTGYSFNLDGTNIYMTLAALFIAQALDVELTLGQQLLLLAVAMISSKGAAGVTGAGFITLAATLAVVPGLPVAGMALFLGIDRFMSECRALTNFLGNAVACVVVARWEGAVDEAALDAALRPGTGLAAGVGETDAD
jgi:aerobic C4-dicarboxylate transport protein